MKVHRMKAGSDEWLEFRKDKLGGSEIATVLGLNPYKSELELWAEKTGRIEPEEVDNKYVRIGQELEQAVIHKFRQETGLNTAHFDGITVQHEDIPWMTASPDGLAFPDGVDKSSSVPELIEESDITVESKTSLSKNANKIFENDNPPEHYKLQTLWYCGVLDNSKAYMPVILRSAFGDILEIPEKDIKVAGVKFINPEIEVDDDTIAHMIEAGEQFIHKVKNDIRPDPDGSDSASRAIEKMYDDNYDKDEDVVVMGKELDDLVEEREEIKDEISKLDDKKSEIDQRLKSIIGDNYGARGKEKRVIHPRYSYTKFDKDKLKEKYPDVADDEDVQERVDRSGGIRVYDL